MRMFGRPRGALGRLGGRIMGRMNAAWGKRTASLLVVTSDDRVLEVGFGPGVIIEHLSKLAREVGGIDPSPEMLEQASARNAAAIREGRVRLRLAPVDRIPFDDNIFDRALAINAMQVWPDARSGLREILRVLKPGGHIALGFTPHSRQSKAGLAETLAAAGFSDVRLVEEAQGLCVLATKGAAVRPDPVLTATAATLARRDAN